MRFLIKLLATILPFILLQHEALATSSLLVLPVTKRTDAAKSPLYSVQPYFENSQYTQQDLLIDLDAPFTWHSGLPNQESCQACPVLVRCDSNQCTDIQNTFAYNNPSCPPPTNDSSIYDMNYCEICPIYVVHPVTGACDTPVLPTFDDKIKIPFYNGLVTTSDLYTTHPTAAVSPPDLFNTFPQGVLGVLALSTSNYALPAYINDPVEKIVALCLSSNSDNGVLLFGNGPYYLTPQPTVDVRSYLSYTALLKHPKSFGYFIGVNSVVIKKRSLNLTATTTTKISTLDPYTVMRSDVYSWVVRRVISVTKRVLRANVVAPFGVCYNISTGPVKIPNIDLVLQDGKTWTISTANSIKQVDNNVACLAFVDGGATSEHGIVIGTYQIEDNFLMFNWKNSTLGFSSSLTLKKSSCSFHF